MVCRPKSVQAIAAMDLGQLCSLPIRYPVSSRLYQADTLLTELSSAYRGQVSAVHTARQEINMTTRIPWDDQALLVCDDDGQRRIVANGTLETVMTLLKGSMRVVWPRYHISLPDRRIAPFEYGANSFDELVRQLRSV